MSYNNEWIFLVLVPGVVLFFVILFGRQKSKRAANIESAVSKNSQMDTSPSRGEGEAASASDTGPGTLSPPKEQTSFWGIGLARSRSLLHQGFDRLFQTKEAGEFFDTLEEILLQADVGLEISDQVKSELRSRIGFQVPSKDELKKQLEEILSKKLLPGPNILQGRWWDGEVQGPRIVLIVGVNGAGKTTTVAKLAHQLKERKLQVLVGAADTFRAGAVDQLRTWADRIGVDGVFQKEGSDPASVVFDSIQAAKSRGVDIALIDTAGRLHTKSNLMDELAKVKRVAGKAMDGAPHDVWLVLDGTNGQNALRQAHEFHKAMGLTGVIVTKLDGSAKGGALFSVAESLSVPILVVGTGEGLEDLHSFQPTEFTHALLEDMG